MDTHGIALTERPSADGMEGPRTVIVFRTTSPDPMGPSNIFADRWFFEITNVQHCMSTSQTRSNYRELSSSIPIWIRLPIKAIAILLVILIPTLYISSLEPTGILGLSTAIASSALVLIVTVALVPVGFAILIGVRRGYAMVKRAIVRN